MAKLTREQKNQMKKVKSIIKENKMSILMVIIIASVAYAGLSLWGANWKLYGQILSPCLGVVIYIILKLINGGKNE